MSQGIIRRVCARADVIDDFSEPLEETMQKAFAELERSGLIVTQRTNGRTVTEDVERINTIRQKLADELVESFFGKMKELGYTKKEVIQLVDKSYEGEAL